MAESRGWDSGLMAEVVSQTTDVSVHRMALHVLRAHPGVPGWARRRALTGGDPGTPYPPQPLPGIEPAVTVPPPDPAAAKPRPGARGVSGQAEPHRSGRELTPAP